MQLRRCLSLGCPGVAGALASSEGSQGVCFPAGSQRRQQASSRRESWPRVPFLPACWQEAFLGPLHLGLLTGQFMTWLASPRVDGVTLAGLAGCAHHLCRGCLAHASGLSGALLQAGLDWRSRDRLSAVIAPGSRGQPRTRVSW